MTVSRELDRAAELIRSARRIVALTGAGVSAESGVPTFRDALTGLWAHFRPEDLATPEAFARDSKLVWEWYLWRRELVAKVEPNAGHVALAELERRAPHMTLVTQNVDGLHHRAGSRNVIELHGNLARSKCSRENRIVDERDATSGSPPPCPQCGAPLRPDVVWFGEMLPEDGFARAVAEATACDVFLSIGTSGLVAPASHLPLFAQRVGAALVVINLEQQELVDDALFLRGPSGEVLPRLVARAFAET